MGAVEDSSWSPRRSTACFALSSQVGPYRLGPELRAGEFGPVHLALHDDHDEVLELERYTGLQRLLACDESGRLAADLGQASTLEHRHLASLVGTGVFEGAPYVARAHCAGRTLEQVLAQDDLQEPEAFGILYAVAEVLAFLSDAGPRPGACVHGGVSASEVLLGYDGRILLLGAGLQFARRQAGEPEAEPTDRAGLITLAKRLGADRAADIVREAMTLTTAARALAREEPDACGLRHRSVAGLLRARDEGAIAKERRRLGLPTLH